MATAPFSAPVVYDQPEFEELMRRFPYVNPGYKGGRFDPVERCRRVSQKNREVEFEIVHIDYGTSTDMLAGGVPIYNVLAEMLRRRVRPALYEELLAFAEKYPDEQRKYPIIALGSETYVRGRRHVPCLGSDERGRRLSLAWLNIDSECNTHERYLAVPTE